jgi:hypothetical protein
MKTLGYITAFVLSMVVSSLLHGWVLTIMWGWFMVPVFHLPRLSLVPAIGIGLTIRFLIYHSTVSDPDDKGKSFGHQLGKATGLAIFVPLLILVEGWVIHLFM